MLNLTLEVTSCSYTLPNCERPRTPCFDSLSFTCRSHEYQRTPGLGSEFDSTPCNSATRVGYHGLSECWSHAWKFQIPASTNVSMKEDSSWRVDGVGQLYTVAIVSTPTHRCLILSESTPDADDRSSGSGFVYTLRRI